MNICRRRLLWFQTRVGSPYVYCWNAKTTTLIAFSAASGDQLWKAVSADYFPYVVSSVNNGQFIRLKEPFTRAEFR